MKLRTSESYVNSGLYSYLKGPKLLTWNKNDFIVLKSWKDITYERLINNNFKMSFTCKYCKKIFSRKYSLNRHLKEIHLEKVEPVPYPKEVWGFKCLEPDCSISFQQGKHLIEHLEKIHNLTFENEVISFTNLDEFYNWKQSVEEESGSYYVVSNSKKHIKYYNCNRTKTGSDKPRCLDKHYQRKIKSQGLCHIDSSCTSQIKAVQDIDGKITVHYQKKHYGHEIELAKIRLPKQEREKIIAKLIIGVPPKEILDTVCNDIGENLRRIDLLTMKDINNIKRQNKKLLASEDITNSPSSAIAEADEEHFCDVFENTNKATKDKLIKNINDIFFKLQNFDFKTLDDSTLEKIYYHLNIIENINPKASNKVGYDFVNKDLINVYYKKRRKEQGH